MKDSGEIGRVFTFRPVPRGDVRGEILSHLSESPHDEDEVTEVNIEQTHTERAYVNPTREPYREERRESKSGFRIGTLLHLSS
ncbi:hypothetical protein DFP74_2340 [Nocardiopsis sp. Huas11]|nr:hypothetical protein DFP74_2340 [Nocardiopsis sp. Huas11]